MKKNILTVFCSAENVHLVKDVGMIPFLLHRNHQHNATLATYKNGNYPYLEKEVKGLNIVFIKKIFNNPTLDVLLFLLWNARKYDVFMTFHLGMHSRRWFWLYKLMNPKGITYLKLDVDLKSTETAFFISKGVKKFVQTVDIISCETTLILKKIEQMWQRKVEYIPNGFLNFDEGEGAQSNKEKTILSVGRLASAQKNIQLLIKAFCKISHLFPEWNLVLVGEIDESTRSTFNKIRIDNSVSHDKIAFKGHVEDRKALNTYYKKASVFALPSIYEGFPLVYLEAAKEGCYIISSDIPPALDITDNARLGTLFKNNDQNDLENKLISVLSDISRIQNLEQEIKHHAYTKFHWPVIIEKINKLICS